MSPMDRRQVLAAVSAGAAALATGGTAAAADRPPDVSALRKRREELKGKAAAFVGAGGPVLDFYHVHILPERPAGGGPAEGELKVDPPAGTKHFHVWLAGFTLYFLDPKSGQAVERPVFVQDVHVEAYKKDGQWLIHWRMGWADAADTTPWEGEISLFGIATG